MRTARLDDGAITESLQELPGWAREGDSIAKTFTFPTFLAGIAFVARVAQAAEEADHHPDVDIRYNRVKCALSTHDSGGVTRSDTELAARIEELAVERR